MTHAVLIAATAERSCNPHAGDSRPSTAITNAFETLQATSNEMMSHSGVGAIRLARCSHGIAIAATGPAAKMRRDAPTSRHPPSFLRTGDLSGAPAVNLTDRGWRYGGVTDCTLRHDFRENACHREWQYWSLCE